MLAPINGLFTVVLAYDGGGQSYYPQLPPTLNTLRSMTASRGYWIRMTAPGTLTVTGQQVAESLPISLRSGWNLIGFPPRGPEAIESALTSINGSFTAVLGYGPEGGQSYYPSLPPSMNTLRALDVKRGYWVKMTQAGTLTFPAAPATATPIPTPTSRIILPATPTPTPTPTLTPTISARLPRVDVPSVIISNTTWQANNTVYVANSTVTVNQGVTLTVEPGAIVKFAESAGLVVNGSIVAAGASTSPIIFTSLKDDSVGGDTNGNGAQTSPRAGDWTGIQLGAASGASRLVYARILFSGAGSCCSSDPAAISVSGSSPVVDHVVVEQGTTHGILLSNSAAPTITDSRIASIGGPNGTAITIRSSSAPTVRNNVFENNGGYAVRMDANAAPRFAGNRASSNGTNGIGVNGTIAPSVAWDADLPYVVDGGLTVNPSITLTLQAGTVVKVRSGSITVNGTLKALGTSSSPIVFTSAQDDAAGGDTNNDASQTVPALGDWASLIFGNTSVNSQLDYVVARYGGASSYPYASAILIVSGSAPSVSRSRVESSAGHGVYLTNVAAPTITDSTIVGNSGDGLRMDASAAPTVTGTGFVDNSAFAMEMDATCAPSLSGNTASGNAYNGIGVAGTVTSSTDWPSGLPYIITGGLTINSGVVLTLQPGVVVKLRNAGILVNGVLRANGTADNKIVFTSLNDASMTAAGQTFGPQRATVRSRTASQTVNIAASPLVAGDWGQIEFASTASASTMNYAVVRFGGSSYLGSSVHLNNSAPSITNTIISNSSGAGLRVSSSSPTISGNTFTANAIGIVTTSSAQPVVRTNQIFGNSQYGLYNESAGVTIDATNTWWGQPTGPTAAGNPGGTGDRIAGLVAFSPWLTSAGGPTPTPVPTPTSGPTVKQVSGGITSSTTWSPTGGTYLVVGSMTVGTGVTLTIQPGTVVKFVRSQGIHVDGTLAASGTAGQPIVFTSDRDDDYGGDSNGDGTTTRPASGDWSGLTFGVTASASSLNGILLRYAGNSISIDGSSPSILDSTVMLGSGSGIIVSNAGAPTIRGTIVRDNRGDGIVLNGASPLIENNTIVSNGGAAIRMSANSAPTPSGNQAYYNGYNGTVVSGSVSARVRWRRDLPYVIDGGLDINTGVVLTIDPGVILKLTGGSITVNGGLVATGTATDRITITSLRDDRVGGDTNNDRGESAPSPGDWSAIAFTVSSLSSSSLTYADVSYGGVTVRSSAPTIANSTIAFSGSNAITVDTLAAPTIRDNVIRQSRGAGLSLGGGAAPTVQNNQFIANQGAAVSMDGSATPTFSGNTVRENGLNGVQVSGGVTSTNTWKANLPYIVEYLAINPGVTLALEPGAILKLNTNTSITVNGNLSAVGTAASPITITSLRDDTIGGDTNNDGGATSPAPGDWLEILFNASSTNSRLTYATVRYGSKCSYYCYPSVHMDGAAVPLQNVTVSRWGYQGISVKDSSPAFSSIEVSEGATGLVLENAHVTITASSFHDNAGPAITGSRSSPTITGSIFNTNDTGSTGVSYYSGAVRLTGTTGTGPTINGNTFGNNRTGAISIEPSALVGLGRNTFIGTVGNGIVVGSGTLGASANLLNSGVYTLYGLTVGPGATLTVEPGAIVKVPFQGPYGGGLPIGVSGALQAVGTSTQPIIFTSDRDDAVGGDTNGDGAATVPAMSDWASIYLSPTSQASRIEYATLRYAGQFFYLPYPTGFTGAGIYVDGVSPTIRNSVLDHNGSYGIYIAGGSPTIDASTINASSIGIYADGSSSPTITGNAISVGYTQNYNVVGISVADTAHPSIAGNTFGPNDIAVSVPAAALPLVGQNSVTNTQGNRIHVRAGTVGSSATVYSGITYVFENITIAPGTALTAQPGAVIKFVACQAYCGAWYRGLVVRGRLLAQGTATQPITFTSVNDDTVGGDTDDDGANSPPAAGDWSGIYIRASDSVLDHVIVRYGGQGWVVDDVSFSASLILKDSAPSVTNSTIAQSGWAGIHVRNTSPRIDGNDISGNVYGVYTDEGARPRIVSNNIHGNSYYGVYNADTSLVVDAMGNWWGDNSGPRPVGSGDAVNYSDRCCDAFGQNVRTYYVLFDPWTGQGPWGQQNLGSTRQWMAFAADPVNTATGNYTYHYQDLQIPGRGLSVAFDRFYNSLSTPQGPLGYGWTFNYGLSVREETGQVSVTREDGRLDPYIPDSSGGYIAPKGVYDTLAKSGGLFTLTRKDQVILTFTAAGKLGTIVDRNGNTIALAYTGGNLTSVTDPTGRVTTLGYDGANRITLITDPSERTARFAYDAAGDLVSVTDARGKTTRYTYDVDHRLLTMTDANDHVVITNVYDGNGRVIRQRDARSSETTFAYDTQNYTTRVTDPRGNTTTYVYDSGLRLQSVRDAANQTTTYSYDSNNNRTTVSDRRGAATRFEYDNRGNTTKAIDPLGGTTTITYTALNDPETIRDPLGHTTTRQYDARGNVSRIIDADGKTTLFTHDSRGLLTSVTDPRNNTTTYGYDTHGYRTSMKTPLDETTTLTYDLVGRKVNETDPLNHRYSFSYDANNNLLTVTDPAIGVTTYTYDAVGNRRTVTDPLNRVTTFSYDAKDKLVNLRDALSGEIQYEYDTVDNRTRELDQLNRETRFTYDALNRLTQIRNPLGQTTTYGYDAEGNRTTITDGNGRTSILAYDTLQRLTQLADPLLNATGYAYDAAGNKIRVTDANGNTTSFGYDSLNRLTSVTDTVGNIVSYGYDGTGNRISVTDANGHASALSYDANNHLTGTADPLGNSVTHTYDVAGNRASTRNARGQTISYTYDGLNRLVGVAYPDSTSVTFVYDAAGNRTSMTDRTGTTTYAYDGLDRLTSVGFPGSRTVGYSYDAAGNRVSVTYPDSSAVTYGFDDANRLARVTDWANRVTQLTYDNAGNLAGQTNPNGTTVTYAYDPARRLTGLTHANAGGTLASISYTLDRVGNRTRVVDPDGTTSYTYDRLYRLTGVTYPDETTATFEYDAAGNRTKLMTGGVTTTYTYDVADRLLSAGATSFTWDADGNLLSRGGTTFGYDAANRLTRAVTGGTTIDFAYDGDGRRASKSVNGVATSYTSMTIAGLPHVLTEDGPSGTARYTYGVMLLAQTDPSGVTVQYHADGLGSTRLLTDTNGSVVARRSYEPFGAVRSQSGLTSVPFTFAGEQADPETGLTFLRARYYDPSVGRLLSRDPFSGELERTQGFHRYAYVSNSPTNLVDPTGKFAFVPILAGAAIGGLAGAAGYTVKTLATGEKFKWGDLAVATGGGAIVGAATPIVLAAAASGVLVTGAVSAPTAATLVTGEVGAAVGFNGSLLKDTINNRPLNWANATADGALSAISAIIPSPGQDPSNLTRLLFSVSKSVTKSSLLGGFFWPWKLIHPDTVYAPGREGSESSNDSIVDPWSAGGRPTTPQKLPGDSK